MDSTSEPLVYFYLLQKVAVAVQRDNTAAILGSSYIIMLTPSKSLFFPFDNFLIASLLL